MDTEQCPHSTLPTNSHNGEIGTGKVFYCSNHENNHKSIRKENVGCHEKGHNPTRQGDLPCKVCRKFFISLASFFYHMSSQHLNKLLCPLCDFLGINLTELKAHIRAHDRTKPLPRKTTTGKFCCELCLKSFKTSSGLWCHKKKSRCVSNSSASDAPSIIIPSVADSQSKGAQLLMQTMNIDGETVYSCAICDHKTKRESNLKTHFLVHTEHRPFGCLVKGCKYRAKSFQQLRDHSRRIHQIKNLRQQNANTSNQNLGLSLDYDSQTQFTENFSMAFACMWCGFIGDSVSAALNHAPQHKPSFS